MAGAAKLGLNNSVARNNPIRNGVGMRFNARRHVASRGGGQPAWERACPIDKPSAQLFAPVVSRHIPATA